MRYFKQGLSFGVGFVNGMSKEFYTHMPALDKKGQYDLTETYNGAFGNRGLSIVEVLISQDLFSCKLAKDQD